MKQEIQNNIKQLSPYVADQMTDEELEFFFYNPDEVKLTSN